MFENKKSANTPLSNLGEFALIEHLTKKFNLRNKSSLLGIGDDAAIINDKDKLTLITTDLLIEGVHFDLGYVPLKHLGYKSVMVNLSDLYAMNIYPSQITTSIAVSNRFSLEALEEIYKGIQLACKNYNVDLIGGDTSSSKTGLIISITAAGFGDKNRIVNRKGAKENDLLVVSGDLGGAYVGLQVLEREKAVFKVNPNTQPDLSIYSYCIEKQLKPEARKDVIKLLDELEVIPTSMIDISDGLSTEINHLSSASGLSFHIIEDQIPISDNTKSTCEEFKIDTSIASLNGGEDYELLFTTSKKNLKKIQQSDHLSVVGTCVNKKNDNCMITSLGQKININSSGWDSFNSNN